MTTQISSLKSRNTAQELEGWFFLTGIVLAVLGIICLIASAIWWLLAIPANESFACILGVTDVVIIILTLLFIFHMKKFMELTGTKWGTGETVFLCGLILSIIITTTAVISIAAGNPIPLIGWVSLANIVVGIISCILYGETGTTTYQH